jgi:cytochrome P450
MLEQCCTADGMVDSTRSSATTRTHETIHRDTKAITLHVLMLAGCGVQHDFDGGATDVAPGHSISFVTALSTVLETLPLTWLASSAPRLFRLQIFPEVFRHGVLVFEETKRYLDEMIIHQTQQLSEARSTTANSSREANLLESLLRASTINDGHQDTNHHLNVDDVRGNLYMFNFAGHETTSNALCFAISLLAVYPKWQDWIYEEVKAVGSINDYAVTFPKMKRCRALMVWLP